MLLRPEPPKILTPEMSARQALAKLQGQPEDGKILSEVSQILRRYIGTVFYFQGGEMTTAEFCDSISSNEKMGTELSASISIFLYECDVRKFSPTNSRAPINAVQHAQEFVVQIQQQVHPVKQGEPKP
jgi:hypothetical protein